MTDPRRLGYRRCSDGLFRKLVELTVASDRAPQIYVLTRGPGVFREESKSKVAPKIYDELVAAS